MIYDFVAALMRPLAWWGRLRVEGLDEVSRQGPLLVVPNHDSQFDPILIALAIKPRRRLRFLARASLWRIPGLGALLYGINQIPISRGTGDSGALDEAVAALEAGESICIFPEGGLSWGVRLRAHSGVGRLAERCPGARVVLCAIEGTTEYARFPRRPRVRVTFFRPAAGDPQPGEEAPVLATRLLDEIRDRVTPNPAGRRARVGGPPRVQRASRRASRS
ncbi:MAG: 1-acyl-sn-glycerol-3-phosphate acyltransferase [Actinomycetota bacterium]|nr:1-acyl-sn-glycerol-3-phosphate acyltransferase [Actinomycetota bacterium]